MTEIVRINDEVITDNDFIKQLKLTGRFDALIEDFVKERLTLHAAKHQGITVTTEDIQERADQLRRVRGLHRASDMMDFLETMGITVDEFEAFVANMLYQEEMMKQVCSDDAIKEYFNLNSPRFDSIEVNHIVVDSEGKGREIMSFLEDEPDLFEEMARQHSLADTDEYGSSIGKVMRGSLPPEIEAKVFNASEGDLLGPFATGDDSYYEIFRVNAKTPASLDKKTKTEVHQLVQTEWLTARKQEHRIEVL